MIDDARGEVRRAGERLRVERLHEGERLRARAGRLRGDSRACTLCGTVASADDLLPIGSLGSLCGD
jgi:hypothetical protein